MKTVEPLATPEPTTWGESGGDSAVCWMRPQGAITGVYVCLSMTARADVCHVILSGPLVIQDDLAHLECVRTVELEGVQS